MNKTKIIISLILIIVSIVLLLVSTNLLALAETNDTTPTAAQCTTEMRSFIKQKSTEFRTYLEQHFKNKSTNSSLFQLALQRFNKYKMDLRKKLVEFSPRAGISLSTEASQNCIREQI